MAGGLETDSVDGVLQNYREWTARITWSQEYANMEKDNKFTLTRLVPKKVVYPTKAYKFPYEI